MSGLALLATVSAAAHAQQTSIDTGAELALIYNDNYRLGLGDGNDQSSGILALTPNITARMQGLRSSALIEYQPQFLYFEDSDNQVTRHNLRADARAGFWGQSVVVQASADISPRFVGQGRSISGTPYNLSPFRRTIQNYAVGPSFQRRISDTVRLTGRYRFGIVRSSIDDSPTANPDGISFRDSNNHAAGLELEGAVPGSNITWKAGGDFVAVDRSGAPTQERLETSGGVRVPIIQGLKLLAEAGYFNSDATRLFDSGLVWRAGFIIDGRRTKGTIRAGRRAGLTTYDGELSYDLSDRTRVEARFVDDLESSQSVQSRLLADRGRETVEGIERLAAIEDLGFDFSGRLFRRRRGDIGFTFDDPKFRANLKAFWEKRNFDDVRDGSRNTGLRGDVTWRLTDATRFNIGGEFRQFDFGSTNIREDDLYRVRAGFEKRFARGINLQARITYGDRNSNLDEFDGTETIGLISISARF